MAAYNYLPYNYQPNYYSGMYQPMQQPLQPMQQAAQVPQPMPQQQPQIRQNGFVRVQTEEEAYAYPIAPGNSITFINENAPYCYVKTLGFSQLDRPTFEKYKLVKEDASEPQKTENAPVKENVSTNTEYVKKSDLASLRRDIEALRVSLKTLNERKPKKPIIIEEDEDDE